MTGQPTFRIYLATPRDFDPAAFAPVLLDTVAAADVACVEIGLSSMDETTWRATIAQLRAPLQDRGIAVILVDRPELARETGCDGVRLLESGSYRHARQVLGSSAIVGVATGSLRHDAMLAGEAGADFVMLSGDPDLIGWWSELFEVPCVALADGLDFRGLDSADFIRPGPSLWDAGPLTDAPARLRKAVGEVVSRG